MLLYTAKRLMLGLAILLIVVVVLFSMIHILPGDPVTVALGPHANQIMRAHFREQMGLDLPLPVQFLRFLSRLATGDLGADIWSGAPVTALIRQVLPDTMILAGTSLLWSVALGTLLGCIAALRRDRWPDWLIGTLSVGLVGMPSFLVALLLLMLFAVKLNWLPAIGAGEPGNLASELRALILPSIAVGAGWVGYTARLVRTAMLGALQENYVRTFRAFGVPGGRIVLYALRQAMVSVTTVIAVGLGSLISGAVFAEIVFSRPGIGRLTYDAVSTRNYPVVMGAVLVTTVLYVVAMIVADLTIAALDRRVRAVL
jgi:ABC-type dipeptide/oligopeptide/nickel transport system permease component